MNRSKHRDFSLDCMKAFAIFLVVMDHLIRKSDSPDNPVISFIYSLHMPLFFLVSGILSAKKIDNGHDIWKFWKRKSKLLIPVVVWGLGNVLILKQDIQEFLIWHKFGLWFLWTLFLFFTLYAISQLCLIKNKNRQIETVGLIFPAVVCIALRVFQNTELGGVFNFLNLYNYIFFVLGVMIKRYDWAKIVMSEKVSTLFFAIYIVGLFTEINALNLPMKACGILFVFMVATKFTYGFHDDEMNKVQRLIVFVGQNSLYIYILHYYLIQGLQPMAPVYHDLIFSTPCYYLPFYILIAFGIIAISIAIAKVLNMNRIVGLLLFGR